MRHIIYILVFSLCCSNAFAKKSNKATTDGPSLSVFTCLGEGNMFGSKSFGSYEYTVVINISGRQCILNDSIDARMTEITPTKIVCLGPPVGEVPQLFYVLDRYTGDMEIFRSKLNTIPAGQFKCKKRR